MTKHDQFGDIHACAAAMRRVVEEPREITEMVDVVDYVEVPRVEKTPRIITEDVLESVHVPIVREVPVKRQIEVHTGK